MKRPSPVDDEKPAQYTSPSYPKDLRSREPQMHRASANREVVHAPLDLGDSERLLRAACSHKKFNRILKVPKLAAVLGDEPAHGRHRVLAGNRRRGLL
jgi:hypothetical protein